MPSFINILLNIYAVFHSWYQALFWIWNKIQNSHRRTVRESSQWPDNHNGVITYLELAILECEVQWALGSINMTKVVKVMEFQLSYLKSWKMMLLKCCTQYVSKFGKLSSGRRTGKGQFSLQSQRWAMPKNVQTIPTCTHSHASEAMLKIHQVRLQKYVNWDLPDVQTGFWKGRGTRGKLPASVGP